MILRVALGTVVGWCIYTVRSERVDGIVDDSDLEYVIPEWIDWSPDGSSVRIYSNGDCDIDSFIAWILELSSNLCSNAHVKHVVGKSENGSNYFFESFSTRFTQDSAAKSESSEIWRELIL